MEALARTPPNNSFKPTLLCSTTQRGLTQALGVNKTHRIGGPT